jgi:hypothetical protein
MLLMTGSSEIGPRKVPPTQASDDGWSAWRLGFFVTMGAPRLREDVCELIALPPLKSSSSR